MIDGFVLSGFYTDGIRLYCQMINESLVPDEYAITSVLKARGRQLALKESREIHGRVLKLGLGSNRSIRMKLLEAYGMCGEFKAARKLFDEMPEDDVVASTVMITSYCEHGFVEEATGIFNRVRVKDMVCWTEMIDGLVKNGETNRALNLFRRMQKENASSNEVTIVCVLSACSHLGALELGRWIYSYIGKHEIELSHFVGGALINMFSSCGDIVEAQRIFLRDDKKRCHYL